MCAVGDETKDTNNFNTFFIVQMRDVLIFLDFLLLLLIPFI